jgi:tRNA threonylcarbamoyladenosine biosynthesis protein TsaB
MITILAIDTSTERAAVAIATADGAVYTATTERERRHGRDLIPCVAALMARAGIASPRELDVIGVGIGPGSYTGLRVGVMAAKTLAYVGARAVIGFDSLAAIARNARPEATRISVIGDAQRGDLYVADFERVGRDGPLVAAGPTRIERLADWRARLEPGQSVLGPALESPRIRPLIPADFLAAGPERNHPDAAELIAVVREAWTSDRRDDFWTLEPNYLRKSAAEEKAGAI